MWAWLKARSLDRPIMDERKCCDNIFLREGKKIISQEKLDSILLSNSWNYIIGI
jgi:hypothetical protein